MDGHGMLWAGSLGSRQSQPLCVHSSVFIKMKGMEKRAGSISILSSIPRSTTTLVWPCKDLAMCCNDRLQQGINASTCEMIPTLDLVLALGQTGNLMPTMEGCPQEWVDT